MLTDDVLALAEALGRAGLADRLDAKTVTILYDGLIEIAARVAVLERCAVPPAARVSERDLRDGKVVVLGR